MNRFRSLPALLAFLALVTSPLGAADTPWQITVDTASAGQPISPDLFGIFFEDLNYSADGGLYAELIQNRSFEYSASEQADWGPFSFWTLSKHGGDGQLGLGDARPVHVDNPHYLLLNVLKAGEGVGVSNSGFDGIPVESGKSYEVNFWAYQAYMGRKWGGTAEEQSKPMPVTLRLESKDGAVLAEERLEITGRAWQKFHLTLTPTRTDADARFVLLAHAEGGLALDEISLFPRDTFKGRANGLRRDVAETIADLKPKFMRFPGGCLVHGPGVRHYYDWKKSIGPVEARRGERNSWGYHQTLGLGYFEYFQFCEDIGAAPLPVVTAGVCCQHAGDSPGRGQEGLPLEEMPGYIQDVLDLIEWANGPVTSPWGAKRAAAGHPAPFNLKYVGIGNEDDITPDFKERFKMIFDALKAKHPGIIVIGTAGPFPDGKDFDLGWAYARELKLPVVDEHYYRPPQWFWDNVHRYDHYDRTGPKVYAGEYAAHETDRRNTLRSALAEAAGCIGFERNGDVVHLASYAPLLARRGHTQWTPDMIYFTGTKVYPSINYQVQRLFGQNGGDTLLPATTAGTSGQDRFAISAVRDSSSGDVILKVVNGDDTPRRAVITLGAESARPRNLIATVLTGAHGDVVNEDGRPPAALPVTTASETTSNFEREFPAYSLTVLRFRK